MYTLTLTNHKARGLAHQTCTSLLALEGFDLRLDVVATSINGASC